MGARVYLAVLVLAALLTAGCGQQAAPVQQAAPAAPLSGPPEITSASEEEGMADLAFYIQEHKPQADGSQVLLVAGTHKGRRLTFEVVLAPAWKSQSLGKEIPLTTHSGKLAFRSTGAESDAFVQVLDEIYGSKLGSQKMGKEIEFLGIALGGDPSNLAQGLTQIKTFFESDKDDDYAEFFTNVDLPARRLEIREKDDGYRAPIVKALQAH